MRTLFLSCIYLFLCSGTVKSAHDRLVAFQNLVDQIALPRTFGALDHFKKGFSLLCAQTSPYGVYVAGGSLAAVAFSGMCYWQLRKNAKGIKRLSNQVSFVQHDLSAARAEISAVDLHLEQGFQNAYACLQETQTALEIRLDLVEKELREAIAQEGSITREAIEALQEELEKVSALLAQVRREQEERATLMLRTLEELKQSVHAECSELGSTHNAALLNLEERTQLYFDSKFQELSAKQDVVINMLSARSSVPGHMRCASSATLALP